MALMFCVGLALSFSLTAFAAELTVNIDNGTSVTLKDTDSDGYYEIGTDNKLYAFTVAVNGGRNGSSLRNYCL